MKRFTYLMISIILLCSIAVGCNKTESTKSGFKYGTYKIEKVKHLPIFSSSSPDYFLEQNEGVRFVVKNGSFSTDTTNSKAPSVHKVDYDNVKYVEENLNNVILTMGKDVGDIGKIDLSSYNEKLCFKVMANSEDTGFRIYCFDKEVWIAYFSWFGEKKDIWTANYIFSVSYKESQAEAITNNEIENQQLLRNITQNSVEVKSEDELIRQYINSTQGAYRELNVSYNSDYGTKMLYIYGDGLTNL